MKKLNKKTIMMVGGVLLLVVLVWKWKKIMGFFAQGKSANSFTNIDWDALHSKPTSEDSCSHCRSSVAYNSGLIDCSEHCL